MRKNIAIFILSATLVLTINPATMAQVLIDYDFDSVGQLSENLDSVNVNRNGATVQESANGGLNDSGSIAIDTDNMSTCAGGVNICPKEAFTLLTSKSGYRIGPVGSSYTFSAYVKSIPRNGRFSVGFTSKQAPESSLINLNTSTNGGPYYRPADALGFTGDSGSFFLNNGQRTADIKGYYDGFLQLPDRTWINPISPGVPSNNLLFFKQSSSVSLLNSGSPDNWYYFKFNLTRNSDTTFNSRLEVWPSEINGDLITQDVAGNLGLVVEQYNIENQDIINSNVIYSYISFAGDQIRAVDEYKIDLAGGATLVSHLSNSSNSTNNLSENNSPTSNSYAETDLGSVYFAPGSSRLSNSAKKQIQELIASNPNSLYKITGYVQKARTSRNDQRLSEARARAVEQYLVTLGAGTKFTVVIEAGKVPAKDGTKSTARRATVYSLTPVVK